MIYFSQITSYFITYITIPISLLSNYRKLMKKWTKEAVWPGAHSLCNKHAGSA